MSVFRGASVGVTLTANKSKYSRELKQARAEMKDWQQTVERSAGSASRVFKRFGAVAGLGLAAASAGAFKVGMDFDKEMSKVQALTGATGEEFQALRKEAIKLGASTSFSAREAAGAMSVLGAAGLTTAQTLKAIPGVLHAAAASGEEMEVVASILTSTMNAFNLEASQTGHIADVLAAAANASDASISDLGLSMKYVAPVANAAGQSLENTAAALTVLANNGIKADTAGTALRAGLLSLASPAKPAQLAIKELGVQMFDMEGNMKPLPGIIDAFSQSFKGLTQEQKLANLADIFGRTAAPAWIKLIDEGSASIDQLGKSYLTVDGEAKKMGETMRRNVAGAADEAAGAAETLGITLYDLVKVPLRDALLGAADGMAQMAARVQAWADSSAGRQAMSDFASGVRGAGNALATVGRTVASVTGFLVAHRTAVTNLAIGYGAFRVVTGILTPLNAAWQLGQANAMKFAAANAGASRAAIASRVALGALGGPIGIAAVAAGVGATAFVRYQQKMANVKTQAERTSGAIRSVGSAMRDLSAKAMDLDEARLNRKISLHALTDAKKRLKDASKGTVEYRDALVAVEQAELGVKRANQQVASSRAAFNKAIEKTSGAHAKAKTEAAKERAEIARLEVAIGKATAKRKSGVLGADSARAAEKKLNGELKNAKERLDDANQKMDRAADRLRNMAGRSNEAASAWRNLASAMREADAASEAYTPPRPGGGGNGRAGRGGKAARLSAGASRLLAGARTQVAIDADPDRALGQAQAQMRAADAALAKLVAAQRRAKGAAKAKLNDRVASARANLAGAAGNVAQREQAVRDAAAAKQLQAAEDQKQAAAEQKAAADEAHQAVLDAPRAAMTLTDAMRDLERAQAEATETLEDDLAVARKALADERSREALIRGVLARTDLTDAERADQLNALAASTRAVTQLTEQEKELAGKTGSGGHAVSLADLQAEIRAAAQAIVAASASEAGNVFNVAKVEQSFPAGTGLDTWRLATTAQLQGAAG